MESLETQVLDDNEGLPTQLPKANTDISHQDAKVNPIWNLFPIGEYGWVHQCFFSQRYQRKRSERHAQRHKTREVDQELDRRPVLLPSDKASEAYNDDARFDRADEHA
jgi:hypothetical protein